MITMVINNPSLANINLLKFGEEVEELYASGVRMFHIDLMDGHYVKNLCFPASVVKSLKEKYPDVTMEVHLMVDNPFDYVQLLASYGCSAFGFHLDSTSFSRRLINDIHSAGMKAGVAINPSQPINLLEPLVPYLDYVIFMSVEPGFAGQKFISGSLERLIELNKMRERMGYNFKIIVDGGVNYDIAKEVVSNGADALVTNIYMIFNQDGGIKKACERFEKELNGR